MRKRVFMQMPLKKSGKGTNRAIGYGLYSHKCVVLDEAIENILKIYAAGVIPNNVNDMIFWGGLLAKKKGTTLYQVIGDSFKSIGKEDKANHFYALSQTTQN